MSDLIYITGHRNPDTDSICSVIAYAELKRKFGYNVKPVRLGDISRETKFVLNYFDVPVPDFIQTVKTQISDLSIDVISPASPDVSIKVAWNIMKRNNVKVLPVVDENEKFIGIVTLSDLTGSYMDTVENSSFLLTKTPLINIVETLNAEIETGEDMDFSKAGKVVVAAMTPDAMEGFIEKGDIVITGNRKDTQTKVIELGALCLILTCSSKPEEDVVALANKNKCIILSTPIDTFTAARLINQSIPIGTVMTKENFVSFNIDDFIDDIRDRMLKTRYRSYPVLSDDNKIKGFISRYHLISKNRKKVILLDHNEKSQTVDGIDQAEILEIIDHHRLGDIQTGNPVLFKNEPVGSTCTIIANLYFDNGIKPSRKIAGIMCAAIISDTMKFKSPTCTYEDIRTARVLADIAGINIDEFAAAMFREGSSLHGRTPKEILHQDYKEFIIGKYKIGIGQVNTLDADSLSEIKKQLITYMEEVCENKGFNLVILLLTDILEESSEALVAGKDKMLLEKAFGLEIIENRAYLRGIISRKKQVVPAISAVIEQKSQ